MVKVWHLTLWIKELDELPYMDEEGFYDEILEYRMKEVMREYCESDMFTEKIITLKSGIGIVEHNYENVRTII